MKTQPRTALIGAGAMGGACLRGWLASQSISPAGSAIFDPAPSDAMTDMAREHAIALNPETSGPFEAIVIAVKPQVSATVLPQYAEMARTGVAVSIMAGVSVAALSSQLGGHNKLVRAMPNLPAAIGKGVTGLYASGLDDDERAMVTQLMAAIGDAVWVDNEADIDAVTAISGSGPAYVFLLVEAMAEAGCALGLSPEAAMALARNTVIGAGALMDHDERPADALRASVTSPGGTTAEALSLLDGDDKALRVLMKSATEAARRRAQELSA